MHRAARFALGLTILLAACGESAPPATTAPTPTIAPTAAAAPPPTAAPAPTAAPTAAPAAGSPGDPLGGSATPAAPASESAASALPADAEFPAPPDSQAYVPGSDAASDAAIAEFGALPSSAFGSQNVTQSAMAVYRTSAPLDELRDFYGDALKGANWLGYRTETANGKLILGYQYGGRGPYDIAQFVALDVPAADAAAPGSLVIITIGTVR